MNIGWKGLSVVKYFEGLYLEAYWDSHGQVWTIGWGHTAGVKEGDVITEEQAEEFLKEDMKEGEKWVDLFVTVELNQDEYDALVSFTFNLGGGTLQDSTLLKKLNAEDREGAGDEFLKFVWAGGEVLPGLVKRRTAERELFLYGTLETIGGGTEPPDPPDKDLYKLKNNNIFCFTDSLFQRNFTSLSKEFKLVRATGNKAVIEDKKGNKFNVPRKNLIKIK